MRRLPPTTVVIYVLKWVAILVVTLVVEFGGPAGVLAVVVIALLLGALWRASRTAWMLLVVLEVFALLSAPFTGAAWWAVPLTIVALALLAAPPTRRHVARQRLSET